MALNLTILQLETFAEVVKTGSTVKAAKKLYTSQSSVSKTLLRLEDNLGFQLFYRQNRHLLLTEAGQYFYSSCTRSLEEIEHSILHGRKLAESMINSIRLAASTYLINDIVFYYENDNPNIDISIHYYPEKFLYEMLSNNEVDIVISSNKDLFSSDQFTWVPLMDCHLFIPMECSNTLSAKSFVTLTDLQGKEFSCNNIGVSASFIRALFDKNNLPRPKIKESNDQIRFSKSIENHNRVAIIPSYILNYRNRQTQIVPLNSRQEESANIELPLVAPHAIQHYGLAYQNSLSTSTLHKDFVEAAKHYCSAVISETKEYLSEQLTYFNDSTL